MNNLIPNLTVQRSRITTMSTFLHPSWPFAMNVFNCICQWSLMVSALLNPLLIGPICSVCHRWSPFWNTLFCWFPGQNIILPPHWLVLSLPCWYFLSPASWCQSAPALVPCPLFYLPCLPWQSLYTTDFSTWQHQLRVPLKSKNIYLNCLPSISILVCLKLNCSCICCTPAAPPPPTAPSLSHLSAMLLVPQAQTLVSFWLLLQT